MTPINPAKPVATTTQSMGTEQHTAADALVELFHSSRDINTSETESLSSEVSSTKRRRITLQERSPTKAVSSTPLHPTPSFPLLLQPPQVPQLPPLRSIPLSQLPPLRAIPLSQLLPSPLQVSTPKSPPSTPSIQSSALSQLTSNSKFWQQDEIYAFIEAVKSVVDEKKKHNWRAVQIKMVKKGFLPRSTMSYQKKFHRLIDTMEVDTKEELLKHKNQNERKGTPLGSSPESLVFKE